MVNHISESISLELLADKVLNKIDRNFLFIVMKAKTTEECWCHCFSAPASGGGVREQVKAFESSNSQSQEPLQKPGKQKPPSAAYELFETKGILITQVRQEEVISGIHNVI